VVGNIYLIYGDDEYIRNKKIKEIQKKCNVADSINKIDLNGEEWEEIYDELTLPSFLSSNKIITIYQAETNIFNEKNDKEDLNLPSPYTFFEKILTQEEYRKEILEDLAIIIVFDNKKISKKNKLYPYLTKKNDVVKICECSKLPRIENEKYLLDIAKEKNLNLGMSEIKFLIDLVEKNTYVQVNELMKLCFLNKAIIGEKITKDDIEDVCIKNEEAVVYMITDYILEKKYSEAQKLANIFIDKKSELMLLRIFV